MSQRGAPRASIQWRRCGTSSSALSKRRFGGLPEGFQRNAKETKWQTHSERSSGWMVLSVAIRRAYATQGLGAGLEAGGQDHDGGGGIRLSQVWRRHAKSNR